MIFLSPFQNSSSKHITGCNYSEKIHFPIRKIKEIASLNVKLSSSENELAHPSAPHSFTATGWKFCRAGRVDWINFLKEGVPTITTGGGFFK